MTVNLPKGDHIHTNDSVPEGDSRFAQLRWWTRALEVRLRSVALVLIVLALTTQWKRLRQTWDDNWLAMTGSSAAVSGVSRYLEYFCPMDPGVVSIWPAVCPICSMDLVQRKKHDAQLLPEGVIARMQLSPYRVQLAGIRTEILESRELMYEIPVAGMLTGSVDPIEDATISFQFVAAVSLDDSPLLTRPRVARVWSVADRGIQYEAEAELVTSQQDSELSAVTKDNHGSRVRVRVFKNGTLAAGTQVHGVIRVPAADLPGASSSARVTASDTGQAVLSVPESAVVDHGDRQIVFVESMPGMFDAVAVTLGRRCGDSYPVLSGLQESQRVAVMGAFLIDAETRLNPSLSVAYFGANQTSSESRAPNVSVAKKSEGAKGPALAPDEIRLFEKQKTCPVTDLPLDLMGGPVVSIVNGRKVLLCCEGCEPALKKEPAKYLAKLPPP